VHQSGGIEVAMGRQRKGPTKGRQAHSQDITESGNVASSQSKAEAAAGAAVAEEARA
jgi:hypothetical protein